MRAGAFIAGALLGAVLALSMRPVNTSSCCRRVAYGVRDEVSDSVLGDLGVAIGDRLDLWQYTPDLLDAFGVPHDA